MRGKQTRSPVELTVDVVFLEILERFLVSGVEIERLHRLFQGLWRFNYALLLQKIKAFFELVDVFLTEVFRHCLRGGSVQEMFKAPFKLILFGKLVRFLKLTVSSLRKWLKAWR